MTRLVIHIGDCKSGSTAIQSVLQKGSYASDIPLRYPEAGRRGALNHHRLSNSLFMPQAKAWQAKAWGALADEVSDGPDVAVISSERFEFVDPNALRAALTQYFGDQQPDLHIIAYVRPHMDRVVSGYVQNVKQGIFDGDLDSFVEQMADDGRFHFAPRLARWASVFDTAKLDIRPMIRAQLDGDCVVHDALNCIVEPLGGTAQVTEIPNANKSLSAPALDIVRQLWHLVGQGHDPQKNPKAAVLAQFTHHLEEADPYATQPVILSRSQAQRVHDIYADDARQCDTKVFGRPVMVPALTAAMRQAPPQVPDHPAPAEVTAISKIWFATFEEMQRKKAQRGGRNPNAAQWQAARTPRH